jgi:hypothetical protein
MNRRATDLLGRLLDVLRRSDWRPGEGVVSPAGSRAPEVQPLAAASAPIEFRVEREDLLCPYTRAEIEQRELAVDPMGGAPVVPFGHLNPAWGRFVATLQPDDTLWSFHSHRVTLDGAAQVRTGYVVVRDGMALQPMIASARSTPASTGNDRVSSRGGNNTAVQRSDEAAAVE